ncbi:MAG: dTDP-4-dehydrorhamnose 3,5-epimerase [Bacteroidia bacterium]|nr:dTDP-4-dehydrorhamnose 3,5-epimerase [Bacteroidia bacterium]
MEIIKTEIEGAFIIKHDVFGDSRGFFMESHNQQKFLEMGINDVFVQDNLSMSKKGVVRGLHFQLPPYSQTKLVRVITGAVIDVIVDLRKGSKTYGKHVKVELSEENKLSLYVPPSFAHGFTCLKDDTIFSYKCSNYYNKESERTIQWNDSTLNIDWETSNPIFSDKDKVGLSFENFSSPF